MTATVLIFSVLALLVALGSAAIVSLSATARAAQAERRKKLFEEPVTIVAACEQGALKEWLRDPFIQRLLREGRDVVVSFRPAYVRAEEEGAVSGYAQDVDIRFVQGLVLTRPGKMPVWISDGALKTKSGAIFDALMPVPHSIREGVSFSGVTAENEGFQIEASGCVVQSIGPRRFIEKIS